MTCFLLDLKETNFLYNLQYRSLLAPSLRRKRRLLEDGQMRNMTDLLRLSDSLANNGAR
jgi:hypothetical protein